VLEPCLNEWCSRSRWLESGLAIITNALVEHKVEWQFAVRLRRAHVRYLELSLVKGWKESVAVQILADTGQEDALAIRHLHRLYVSRLAANHKDLLHIVASTESVDGAGHGAGQDDAFWVARSSSWVRRSCLWRRGS